MSLSTRDKLGIVRDMLTGKQQPDERRDWSLTNGGIADSHQEATNCDPHHGMWEWLFWLLGM